MLRHGPSHESGWGFFTRHPLRRIIGTITISPLASRRPRDAEHRLLHSTVPHSQKEKGQCLHCGDVFAFAEGAEPIRLFARDGKRYIVRQLT